MAVNTITTTTAANFIPEIWAPEISDAVQANVVLGSLVDRQYEDDMKFGDTIHIRDASNPAVRFKSADTTATWANITETMQNITINLQAYVAFLTEDIVEVQADVKQRSLYSGKATYSLMATVEGDATSGLASLPDNFSQSVGTLGVDPSDDNFIRASQYLDDADVPEDGRFLYVSPGIYAAMLKIDKFTSQDYNAAPDAITRSRVGMIYNAPVHKSTFASNNPSTSGQAYGWFCHKRGVALIIQRMPQVHSQYIILETGWGVLVDVIYNFAERLIEPKDLGGTTSTDVFNVSVAGP